MTRRRLIQTLTLLALAAGIATANTPTSRMRIGRIWYGTDYDGASAWTSKLQYPGGIARETNDVPLHRGWVGQARKDGTYLFNTDWTDPYGNLFEFMSSYMFRAMNYGYPTAYDTTNFMYVFPGEVWNYQRWATPRLIVNGEQLPLEPPSEPLPLMNLPNHEGDGPRPATYTGVPSADPHPPRGHFGRNLVAEKIIHETWRYIAGVRLDRYTYGFPYGTPHQDYVLVDITLTNDGVIGSPRRDAASVIRHPETLTNVVWAYAYDYQQIATEGINNSQFGADTDGEYIHPAPGVDHAAALVWDGDDRDTPGPDYGDVSRDPQYRDLMIGNCFTLIGPAFVSVGPGELFDADLGDQPLTRNVTHEMGFDFANLEYSPTSLQEQYRLATNGPWQVPVGESYRTYRPASSVASDFRGPTLIESFGPAASVVGERPGWTLAPGDSVRIVLVVAAGGIDVEESRRIGGIWNAAMQDTTIGHGVMSDDDVALYFTGRDTAIKAYNMAWWNLHGEFAPGVSDADLLRWGVPDMVRAKPRAQNRPYNVPDPPRPPGTVSVREAVRNERSDSDFGIEVRFSLESERTPRDPDTRTADFAGYRILRKTASRNAPWETVSEGEPDRYPMRRADGALPAGRVFMDTSASRDERYWYAVTAYDDGSQNWARPGVSLASSPWWTYTGFSPDGVSGRSREARSLDSTRVATNPYSIASASRVDGLRIVFEYLPDSATVTIHDSTGRFVARFRNRDSSYVWTGADNRGGVVGPGRYFFVVHSKQYGTVVRRFRIVP